MVAEIKRLMRLRFPQPAPIQMLELRHPQLEATAVITSPQFERLKRFLERPLMTFDSSTRYRKSLAGRWVFYQEKP
jgi:hypothetical protein